MLYLTLGFRQFSHYFTDIRDAVERGDDEDEARRLLASGATWMPASCRAPRSCATSIEHALLAAHRHVFGVFFWFVCSRRWGPPAGAVLAWPSWRALLGFKEPHRARRSTNGWMRRLHVACSASMDHLPARLTFSFARGQLRGSHHPLASRCRAVETHENEGIIPPRQPGAVGVQLLVARAPGITPDRPNLRGAPGGRRRRARRPVCRRCSATAQHGGPGVAFGGLWMAAGAATLANFITSRR